MSLRTWADPLAQWAGGATWDGDLVGQVQPKVEVEFTDPTDVSTWGDAGTTWQDPTSAWAGAATFVNVNPWTQGATVRRGRQHDLDRVEAGVSTVNLKDPDRRFDPLNAASPYAPDVRPGRRMRITAVRDGVVFPVSTGIVEGWPVDWQSTSRALLAITAADGFKDLGLQDITASRKAETTSDRVNYLLDRAGWSASRRNIEPGVVRMPERSYDGTSILVALQEAAVAEGGVVFLSRAGDVVFHNRNHRLANFQTSQVTLGGPDGLPYHAVQTSYDDADLANEVRAGASSATSVGGDGSGEGTEVVAVDLVSQTRYGRRVLKLGEIKAGVLVAQDTVDYQLDRHAEPQLRFTSVTLQPTSHPTLWRYVLDLELGDRLTVVLTPAVGDPIAQEVHLEQIQHRVLPSWWETDWALTSADPRRFWQLDSNDSELDSTARVGY